MRDINVMNAIALGHCGLLLETGGGLFRLKCNKVQLYSCMNIYVCIKDLICRPTGVAYCRQQVCLLGRPKACSIVMWDVDEKYTEMSVALFRTRSTPVLRIQESHDRRSLNLSSLHLLSTFKQNFLDRSYTNEHNEAPYAQLHTKHIIHHQ